MGKKIVDARSDENGNIEAVKFKGNKNFTNVEKAIDMAKEGKIDDVNVSKSKSGTEYLRKNPNSSKKDNLDTLAEK
jgi:hypothetical protein